MRWFDATRARLRHFGRRAAEGRTNEELRFHIEMETERLVREEGLDPREARRRALVGCGGVEEHKEQLREGRGLAWLGGISLDFKLGLRMLLKYPVLTLASVFALAVAVALAASWFEFMTDIANPRLSFADGDRIVEIENRDLATAADERRSLYDFEIWREEVESIEELSALSPVEYTASTEDGRFATLGGMRVTPLVFQLAPVQPLFGRRLTEADDRPGAPLVAVIGYSAWQRLYDGDRSVIGETIRLGSEYATIVGVMPEGFGIWSNEELWTPLRESALRYGRRGGPGIEILGRLAPGFALEEARAELATIGRRMAAQFPDTHEQLQPEVREYPGREMAAIVTGLNLPFLLFLVVVSANVATLLLARTTTRESEIALRSALGASRRRIVLQLVAEVLVLTSVAAALGLAVAGWGLPRGMDLFWEVQQESPPFWWDSGLSATTGIYVLALAVLGAVIIGGLPGLRATGRRLRHRLAQPGGGGSGMRFGAVATGVIVIQVALCVAFIPVAIMNVQEQLRGRRGSTEFPAEAFLTGRLLVQSGPAGEARPSQAEREENDQGAAALFDEVRRRLAAQSGVVAVTRASRIPGFNHPVEAIGIEGDSTRIVGARMLSVDPNFFEMMGARIVNGRSFGPADVTAATRVVVVDQDWARETLGGNAVGRRIRYPAEAEERAAHWYEVVGVVAGMDRAIGPGTAVGLFRPLRADEHASMQVYLRTEGDVAALVPQAHELVAAVDQRLAIADLKGLDAVWRPVERSDAFFTGALAVISGIILLFALMGIYALMSFTVAQRAREIGIRAALGANPRRIIASIFSRAVAQIGMGVVTGAALVSLTILRSPEGLRLVAGVAAAMVAVGLIGCALPATRALRIQPTDALRVE